MALHARGEHPPLPCQRTGRDPASPMPGAVPAAVPAAGAAREHGTTVLPPAACGTGRDEALASRQSSIYVTAGERQRGAGQPIFIRNARRRYETSSFGSKAERRRSRAPRRRRSRGERAGGCSTGQAETRAWGLAAAAAPEGLCPRHRAPVPAVKPRAAPAAKPGAPRGLPSRLPYTSEPRGAVAARITEHLAAATGTSQPCAPKHCLGGLGKACGGDPGDRRQWDPPRLLQPRCRQSGRWPEPPRAAVAGPGAKQQCVPRALHGPARAQRPGTAPTPCCQGRSPGWVLGRPPVLGSCQGVPHRSPGRPAQPRPQLPQPTARQGARLSTKDARGMNRGDARHQPAQHPSVPRLLSASPAAPKSPITHMHGNTQTGEPRKNPTLP